MARADLTVGSIPNHLKSLWIPATVAMFLQSCYALVNLFFVRLIGDRAVGAHGISVQSFFIILAVGQMVGTTSMADVSQAYGRGDVPRARGLFTAYTLVALGLGIITSIAAFMFAREYVDLMTDDPGIRPLGEAYFEANAPTFLLQLLIIVFSGAMRSSGDYTRPMTIMIMSVILNAALDPLLIFGLGPIPAYGIAGAGYATVIAQLCACAAYVWLFTRKDADARALTFARPEWTRGLFGRIFKRGFPAGVQFFIIYVVTGIVLIAMKDFGPDWTGAASGGFRLMQQVWLPLVTLSMAAATLSGQNYGARNAERIREAARVAIRWGIVYGAIAALATMLLAPLLGWLSAEGGGAQYDNVVLYLRINGVIIVAFAITYVPTFILQAFGKTTLPLIAALVRVALLAVLVFGVFPALGSRVELGVDIILYALVATSFIEGAIGWTFLRKFVGGLRFDAAIAAPAQVAPGSDPAAQQAHL